MSTDRTPPPTTAAEAPDDASHGASAGAVSPGLAARTVESAALFRGATELRIDHGGVIYRLKLTALGKLILTK